MMTAIAMFSVARPLSFWLPVLRAARISSPGCTGGGGPGYFFATFQ